MKNNPKVFGIGFHKTGTTSLAFALKILGYNCNRGLSNLRHIWGLESCVELLQEENYKPYLDYIKDFDATLDNPWYLLYEQLDQAYPGSKFIMTHRHQDKWLSSCAHFFEGTTNPYREWLYGSSTVVGNEDMHLNVYNSHYNKVQEYFQNRTNDLLIVNWESGDGWSELCQFLEKPMINLPFPHLNKKNSKIWET